MEDGKIRVKNVLHFLFFCLFVFNQCEGRMSLSLCVCVCVSVCECVRMRKCVCVHT